MSPGGNTRCCYNLRARPLLLAMPSGRSWIVALIQLVLKSQLASIRDLHPESKNDIMLIKSQVVSYSSLKVTSLDFSGTPLQFRMGISSELLNCPKIRNVSILTKIKCSTNSLKEGGGDNLRDWSRSPNSQSVLLDLMLETRV